MWATMERPQEASTAEEATHTGKKPKAPLWQRMYFQRHMTDVVRAFGYRSVPLEETRDLLKPLLDTYGRTLVQSATDEIIVIEGPHETPVARLTDEARKLAIQILGRPPEQRALQTKPLQPQAPVPAPVQDATPNDVPATTQEAASDGAMRKASRTSKRRAKRTGDQPAADEQKA
jgi:hypothetical protein